jgi:hypothetical protein
MNLTTYLNRHFLDTGALDGALLAGLQQRGMAPAPAYRLRIAVECESFFGAHSETCETHYYASGTPAWLADVAGLPDAAAAHALFAQRYRDRVAQLGAAPRTDAYLREEWQHFLDGTYGLCSRDGLPETIADKEVAAANVKDIVDKGREQVLTAAELLYLRHWVNLLDRASAAFAPHEVARSSRRRLVDDVRAAYGLGSGGA